MLVVVELRHAMKELLLTVMILLYFRPRHVSVCAQGFALNPVAVIPPGSPRINNTHRLDRP